MTSGRLQVSTGESRLHFPGHGREKRALWGDSPVQFQADGPEVTFSIVL